MQLIIDLMSDKSENEALQKYFNSMSRNYPPTFPSHYSSSLPNPPSQSPYPSDHYLPPTDKSKMPPSYADYYKNPLYYPSYPPAMQGKPTYPS